MRKLAVIILAATMFATMSVGALAQEAAVLTPTPTVARPEIAMVRALDESAFAFAYWYDRVFHITPMPGRSAEIRAAVAAMAARHPNLQPVIVDPEPLPGTTYSFAQRAAAHRFLGANMDELRIQGVGFNRRGLGVFMFPGATATDRQAVMAASPISAIEFLEAQAADPPPPIPPGGIVVDTSSTPLPTESPPHIITGASSARRSQRVDWSTFTVSAIRGWNGVSGEAGVLTVGHGFRDGQPVFAGNNGGRIGVADVRLGHNIDVAFVRLDDPRMFPSGYMRSGDRVNRMIELTVFDYGRVVFNHTAAGTTAGQVVLTRHTFRMRVEEGVYRFDNGIVTTNPARAGNSGSPVVTSRTTLGGLVIAAAGTRSGGNWSHSIILPISDVAAITGFLPAF